MGDRPATAYESPEEQRQRVGEIWQTYSGWRDEIETRYTRNTSDFQARMAAAGAKPGTSTFTQGLENLQKQKEAELADLQKGAHYQAINEYFQAQQRSAKSALSQYAKQDAEAEQQRNAVDSEGQPIQPVDNSVDERGQPIQKVNVSLDERDMNAPQAGPPAMSRAEASKTLQATTPEDFMSGLFGQAEAAQATQPADTSGRIATSRRGSGGGTQPRSPWSGADDDKTNNPWT